MIEMVNWRMFIIMSSTNKNKLLVLRSNMHFQMRLLEYPQTTTKLFFFNIC